ncbi:hypothetical protein L1049_002621 [Liquidambar formosana]|uniref:HMG box domain-containing protein n=1 Tax=Liquidambar formosana TaxID=63359 RepID=A0AAP0R7K2_LIQFO
MPRRAANLAIDEDEEFIIDDQGEAESEQSSNYNEDEEEVELRGCVPSTSMQDRVGTRKEKVAPPAASSLNKTAVVTLASDKWRSMSKEDKALYEDIAAKNRADYYADFPLKSRRKTTKNMGFGRLEVQTCLQKLVQVVGRAFQHSPLLPKLLEWAGISNKSR